jgi:hypothetical protein
VKFPALILKKGLNMGQNGKALGVAFSEPEFDAITMADAGNIVVNATTGTKIGTAASQKLAVYGKTPVIQASAIPAVSGTFFLTTTINSMLTVMRNFGLIA